MPDDKETTEKEERPKWKAPKYCGIVSAGKPGKRKAKDARGIEKNVGETS